MYVGFPGAPSRIDNKNSVVKVCLNEQKAILEATSALFQNSSTYGNPHKTPYGSS
jgi:hypothetical protein